MLKYKTRMEVADTLAYYETELITAVKKFMVQAPRANPIILFMAVIYGFS